MLANKQTLTRVLMKSVLLVEHTSAGEEDVRCGANNTIPSVAASPVAHALNMRIVKRVSSPLTFHSRPIFSHMQIDRGEVNLNLFRRPRFGVGSSFVLRAAP